MPRNKHYFFLVSYGIFLSKWNQLELLILNEIFLRNTIKHLLNHLFCVTFIFIFLSFLLFSSSESMEMKWVSQWSGKALFFWNKMLFPWRSAMFDTRYCLFSSRCVLTARCLYGKLRCQLFKYDDFFNNNYLYIITGSWMLYI